MRDPRSKRTVWLVLALAAAASLGTGRGMAAVIDVGTHQLFEDMAGQQIVLMVSGLPGEQVQGLNFRATIADGGLEAGGVMDGPIFQHVDLLTGTIFAGNNEGQNDLGSLPQVATYSVVTAGGSVNPQGVLAILSIDTTGFAAGQSFDLFLSEPVWMPGAQPTDFAGLPIDITHGRIELVAIPEPASLGLLLAGAALLAVRRRRA